MAGSNYIIQFGFNHIEWRDDPPIFKSRSKGYQQGKIEKITWHIYSNRFKPHVWTVLALENYLFSNSGFPSKF